MIVVSFKAAIFNSQALAHRFNGEAPLMSTALLFALVDFETKSLPHNEFRYFHRLCEVKFKKTLQMTWAMNVFELI